MFSFDTPPTPPTAKEDDLVVLRLIRSRRVGPATFHRLIAQHGSAAAALEALPDLAAASGIEGYQACPVGVAAAELAAGRRAGARLMRFDRPDYPPLLARIDDAPPLLWARGDTGALNRPMVAVVGARNASSLGLRMARGMAAGLATSGVTVVAGLARGIDTAAHEASLAQGTVAVMAGGIDVIYPAENRALADRICETGCLLTEQPPGTEPVARHFPSRNRIVSGLSAGVVVIEAAHRSGTLITAERAAEQGREVMAVPGHPIDARAAGCNALIRDGATLVRSAADVLSALGLDPDAATTAAPPLRAVAAAPEAAHGSTATLARDDRAPHATATVSRPDDGHPRARAAADGAGRPHPTRRFAPETPPPVAGDGDAPPARVDVTRTPRPADAGPGGDPGPAGQSASGGGSTPTGEASRHRRVVAGAGPSPDSAPASGGVPSQTKGPAPANRSLPGGGADSGAGAVPSDGAASGAGAVAADGVASGVGAVAGGSAGSSFGAAAGGGPAAGGVRLSLDQLRRRLLDVLSPSPVEEDSLIRDLGVPASTLGPVVLDLELDGRVIRMPGGRLALAG